MVPLSPGDSFDHPLSIKFQKDIYWRGLILFNEYFHGENGAGLVHIMYLVIQGTGTIAIISTEHSAAGKY
jgi:hypothetical protein